MADSRPDLFPPEVGRSPYTVTLPNGHEYPLTGDLASAIEAYGNAMYRTGKATVATRPNQDAMAREAWRTLMREIGAACREIASAYA